MASNKSKSRRKNGKDATSDLISNLLWGILGWAVGIVVFLIVELFGFPSQLEHTAEQILARRSSALRDNQVAFKEEIHGGEKFMTGNVAGDGNCLFRSLSVLLSDYKKDTHWRKVKTVINDYFNRVRKDENEIEAKATGTRNLFETKDTQLFDSIERILTTEKEYGNESIVALAADAFKIPIQIHLVDSPNAKPLIYGENYIGSDNPIRHLRLKSPGDSGHYQPMFLIS